MKDNPLSGMNDDQRRKYLMDSFRASPGFRELPGGGSVNLFPPELGPDVLHEWKAEYGEPSRFDVMRYSPYHQSLK